MRWESMQGLNKVAALHFISCAEGKTKKIVNLMYGGELIEDVVGMQFKDDITAGDGVKHDIMENKGFVDWKTNSNIFQYLNRCGVRTHFVEDFSSGVSIVKRLDQKFNLEVVVRRVATGSILKHTALKEGDCFGTLYTQFFYKDDILHDPLLDGRFLTHLCQNKGCYLFNQMAADSCVTFCQLERAFAKFKIQLVDIKLEYGMINGELTLIDEITAGSFRLWPYIGDIINLRVDNVLNQLNPKGRLDKDVYRQGGSLDIVNEKFLQIWNVTEGFNELGFA